MVSHILNCVVKLGSCTEMCLSDFSSGNELEKRKKKKKKGREPRGGM